MERPRGHSDGDVDHRSVLEGACCASLICLDDWQVGRGERRVTYSVIACPSSLACQVCRMVLPLDGKDPRAGATTEEE